MPESKALWGWDPVGRVWLPVQCNPAGNLVVQLDTLTNLAGDTAGMSAAGIFSIPAQSRFRAYRAGANQPFPNAAWTVVQGDTALYDEQGEYNVATFRWTAAEDGYYQFEARVDIDQLLIGAVFILRVRRNAAVQRVYDTNVISINWDYIKGCSFQDEVTAGDFYELEAYHTCGAGRVIISGDIATFFAVHKLS